MKAILEFNMDDPHDKELHNLMMHAEDWYMVVYDLDKWMRTKIKYDGNETAASMDEKMFLKEIRAMLYSWMEDSGVSLDDLS
jgi:hypothetical protein